LSNVITLSMTTLSGAHCTYLNQKGLTCRIATARIATA
jgi:hypothetical protein